MMKKDKFIQQISAQIKVLLFCFIVLKISNEIDWSWMWILSPLWIGVPYGIAVAVLLSYEEDKE